MKTNYNEYRLPETGDVVSIIKSHNQSLIREHEHQGKTGIVSHSIFSRKLLSVNLTNGGTTLFTYDELYKIEL